MSKDELRRDLQGKFLSKHEKTNNILFANKHKQIKNGVLETVKD